MSVNGSRLLTLVLAGLCGLFLLLALALQIGLGRGYTWLLPDADANAAHALGGIDREPFKLPPETKFAATDARPLFNEDRKPTPDVPDDDAPPAAPPVPLNIALTGVILTPQLHVAMVHDKAKNTSVALKEGMPLPGDQGGWTLTQVKPRSAVFKESSGDEVEVELSTAVASPKGNAAQRSGPERPGAPPAPGSKPPMPPGGPDTAQAQALQHRIEERRAQMRDEATRLKQRQNPPQH